MTKQPYYAGVSMDNSYSKLKIIDFKMLLSNMEICKTFNNEEGVINVK